MPTRGLLERQSLRQVWERPDTFATSLLVLFVDTYGGEGLKWSPQTIRMEIEDDFGINLPQGSFDRLMVARNLLTTDDFYRSLPDFVQWCGVLNGDTYDPLLWDPADAQEVAWGISEALIIEPPDEEEPFNSEIRAYIGAVLDEEGIMNAPDILRLALRNVDLTAKVHGDFSDDPIMFAAIYGFEKSKTDDINNYTRGQLRLLISQLEQLPLRLGETNGVVQRAVQMLS